MNPLRRLQALFRKGKLEREMAEEMRFHLEERTADKLADGLPPAEARYAAQRQFGNLDRIQEQARELRGWLWLENFATDVRLGVRSLSKTPGFTFIAILTLALGIGANTSMFSVINGILLRPLPYPEPEQLERIFRVTAQNPRGYVSVADYLTVQSQLSGYGDVAAYGVAELSLSSPGRPPEMISSVRTSPNLFNVLGVQPQLGRNFRPNEAFQGNHRVLLISHRFWVDRFGGDTHVIGRTLRIDGETNEIIGVLPEALNDWRHLGAIDFYRPLGLTDKEIADRTSTWVRLVGRPSHTLTPAQADGFIAGLGRRLAADFPAVNGGATWQVVSLVKLVGGQNGPTILTMLIGLSGFVLLIACSNLANFLLARTVARAREFAVRGALGASRSQLLRPLVVESLLLALAGGVGAILVAMWFSDYLAYRSAPDVGARVVLALDWHVLGWALAASLVTALAFGFVPALFTLRLDLNQTLKSGGRGTTGDRGHQRFRHSLIVGQFALAMVLLAGAALFVRGLHELNSRRDGWESEHVVTATMLLPAATYPGGKEITDFQRLALERLAALPGVASVSVSYTMPFFGLTESRGYLVAGREIPEPGHEPAAVINGVSPRYFETVGTRVLSGRAFTAADTLTTPRVFIINQAMASGLFGTENPLGRRLGQAGGKTIEWGEIVGVVGDVGSILPDPLTVTYQLYQPMAQEPRPFNEIAIRTAGVAPSALVDSIRTTMAGLDHDLPLRDLQPAEVTVSRANYQLAVLRDMLAGLSLLGLGLAALGIYGVVARTVAQRAGEFGIRLALGAQLNDITGMVLLSGVKLALLGSTIGLLGAFLVARLLAAGFPRMQLDSVPVITGVTLLLVVIALLSCWLPARRASSVDPMTALRAE
jgi:putative ABC transport system permease protein